MLMVWPRLLSDDERDQHGQRNRNRDDQGAAPAAQEHEDHDGRQAGGDNRFHHHVVDGGANEDGLIVHRADHELRRERGFNPRKNPSHMGDQVEG